MGRVRDTQFGTNVSNKMLLNAENARVTDFTVSELLRENQQGGKIIPLLPPRCCQTLLMEIFKKIDNGF